MFGSVVAGLDFDFLHHVRVGGDYAPVVGADVHHSSAVNLHVVVLAAQTVDIVLIAAVGAGNEADLLQTGLIWRDYARQDAQQLDRTAADDREVLDLFGGDRILLGAGLGLKHVGGRRHRHRLGSGADLQRDIQSAGVAGTQDEASLLGLLET